MALVKVRVRLADESVTMDAIGYVAMSIAALAALFALSAPRPAPPDAAERSELDIRLRAELSAGKRIAAIRTYRRLHGVDLKASRQAVDALLAERQAPPSV